MVWTETGLRVTLTSFNYNQTFNVAGLRKESGWVSACALRNQAQPTVDCPFPGLSVEMLLLLASTLQFRYRMIWTSSFDELKETIHNGTADFSLQFSAFSWEDAQRFDYLPPLNYLQLGFVTRTPRGAVYTFAVWRPFRTHVWLLLLAALTLTAAVLLFVDRRYGSLRRLHSALFRVLAITISQETHGEHRHQSTTQHHSFDLDHSLNHRELPPGRDEQSPRPQHRLQGPAPQREPSLMVQPTRHSQSPSHERQELQRVAQRHCQPNHNQHVFAHRPRCRMNPEPRQPKQTNQSEQPEHQPADVSRRGTPGGQHTVSARTLVIAYGVFAMLLQASYSAVLIAFLHAGPSKWMFSDSGQLAPLVAAKQYRLYTPVNSTTFYFINLNKSNSSGHREMRDAVRTAGLWHYRSDRTLIDDLLRDPTLVAPITSLSYAHLTQKVCGISFFADQSMAAVWASVIVRKNFQHSNQLRAAGKRLQSVFWRLSKRYYCITESCKAVCSVGGKLPPEVVRVPLFAPLLLFWSGGCALALATAVGETFISRIIDKRFCS